jgi:hypothetical protein
MTPTVRRRTDGTGFEAGPEALSYRYGVSFASMDSDDEQSYICREFILDTGKFRSYRIGRVGNFYNVSFGKPGDPIPTVEVTDIECPDA